MRYIPLPGAILLLRALGQGLRARREEKMNQLR